MLIKRIKVNNYKTYRELDIDLTVEEDRPIILIGGANGGGKTTFFDSIYGALYGLDIPNQKAFQELLNAGTEQPKDARIYLELHFSGKVLNEDQQYMISRTYTLNPEKKPVESVYLNMNGSIFKYGTATPFAQRQDQEAQVNKIIKANLPKELSRYFLFDAMEAGDLLREDQLNRVIKENIENVMGFNKYLQLAKASESLFQEYTAQRLKLENEKQEYLDLVNSKKEKDQELEKLERQYQDALQYSIANKEIYDGLKTGQNQEGAIRAKVEATRQQINGILKRENQYKSELDDFAKNLELHVGLPKLAESIKNEVSLILKTKSELQQNDKTKLSEEQIQLVTNAILQFLEKNKIPLSTISEQQIVEYLMGEWRTDKAKDPFHYLEFSELKALENLVNSPYNNPFLQLNQNQQELNIAIAQLPGLENQIESYQAQIAGQDFRLLKVYEDNELNIKNLEHSLTELKVNIEKLEKKIHQFDIQTSQEPDPRYETLKSLKPYFEEAADKLLKNKKQQIELVMKDDLNINLAPYKNMIERVELSESLRDLSFKIFHKRGNELYLNQLNTASKQVVVQVLLKALHEYGDYDPPVMIDTVMGVLGEESRALVLENYFPSVAHQTILLSSDSEIRPKTDLEKIEGSVARAYTLVRDIEQQYTSVESGYFGQILER